MITPSSVNSLILQISSDPSVLEIWLIGSRASATAHERSDWDLLVFSEKEPSMTDARVDGIDVLWKGPSGNILLEGMPVSYKFNFSDLIWRRNGKVSAIYQGKNLHEISDDIYDFSIKRQSYTECNAILLWSRQFDVSSNVSSLY